MKIIATCLFLTCGFWGLAQNKMTISAGATYSIMSGDHYWNNNKADTKFGFGGFLLLDYQISLSDRFSVAPAIGFSQYQSRYILDNLQLGDNLENPDDGSNDPDVQTDADVYKKFQSVDILISSHYKIITNFSVLLGGQVGFIVNPQTRFVLENQEYPWERIDSSGIIISLHAGCFYTMKRFAFHLRYQHSLNDPEKFNYLKNQTFYAFKLGVGYVLIH